MNSDWSSGNDVITNSVTQLGDKVANILPDLVGAVIILILGLIIARVVGQGVSRLVRSTGVDNVVSRTPIGQQLNFVPRMRFSASRLIGWAVKWFFILVTLNIVSNILGWTQVNQFLNQIVLYIPNVIIAVVILVIGFIASHFMSNIVAAALERSPLEAGERRFLTAVTRVSIVLFAVMASLIQLKIAANLIEIFFTGIIFAISLSLGLSFGLGAREEAGQFVKRLVERGRNRSGGASTPPMSL